MKKDIVYPYYLVYLDNRLYEGNLSKGSISLLKISSSAFYDFKLRLENDKLFNFKIIELYRAEKRDKKIDDLLDDFN